MKKLNLAIIVIALMMSAGISSAQTGQGFGTFCDNIPDLTQDQKDKIEKLRTVHQKNMLNLRNDMDLLHAELNKLTTADKTDQAAINKKADEIGALKTTMLKKRLEHRMSIRALLTDDQRVFFDSHRGKGRGHGKGCGSGMGRGNGRNCGNCDGHGFGRGGRGNGKGFDNQD